MALMMTLLCLCVHMLYRLYSQDAARTNGGYRSASFCLELRGDDSSNYGFLLPANQVNIYAHNIYL